jgi:hypothetical protein
LETQCAIQVFPVKTFVWYSGGNPPILTRDVEKTVDNQPLVSITFVTTRFLCKLRNAICRGRNPHCTVLEH